MRSCFVAGLSTHLMMTPNIGTDMFCVYHMFMSTTYLGVPYVLTYPKDIRRWICFIWMHILRKSAQAYPLLRFKLSAFYNILWKCLMEIFVYTLICIAQLKGLFCLYSVWLCSGLGISSCWIKATIGFADNWVEVHSGRLYPGQQRSGIIFDHNSKSFDSFS